MTSAGGGDSMPCGRVYSIIPLVKIIEYDDGIFSCLYTCYVICKGMIFLVGAINRETVCLVARLFFYVI